MLIGVVSAASLLGAIAALTATALTEERALRRLVLTRSLCGAAATAVVASSLVAPVPGVWLAMACVALLLSMHAIWLAMREPEPLRSYLDRLVARGDAAWRDEFERPFWRYVRRNPATADGVQPAARIERH